MGYQRIPSLSGGSGGGTAGPPGSPGAPGSPGTAGSTGSAGTAGVPGSPGTAGTPGTNFIYGSTVGAPSNAVGNNGDAYLDAAATLFGPKASGAWPGTSKSIVRSPGSPGTTGTAGSTGSTGSPGSPGTTGTTGAPGSPGTAGTAGTAGAAGTNGSTIIFGASTAGPAANVGNPGDVFFTSAYVVYGPKDATNGWPSTGKSLVGPQGPPGTAGSTAMQLYTGTANWANASTVIATLPSTGVTYGFSIYAVVAYNAVGSQPTNMSLGLNGSASNILGSRSLSGMLPSTFSTFFPSGSGAMGTANTAITVAPVGGAVSGGGTCQIDVLGMLH